jgi:hypothetical protein
VIESVVGLTTHRMIIISNASDEEMSEEKSLAMCKVTRALSFLSKEDLKC